MSARETILNAIQDGGMVLDRPSITYNFTPGDLWLQFEERLTQLGGKIVDASVFGTLVDRKVWVEPAVSEMLKLPNLADDIWDAEFGISLASLAVAQTGSLLMSSGGGQQRLSSLIPPINIVVVSRGNIVGTLAEALAVLPDRNSVFVTGPSRTADIEGVLVRGIHGPKELWVVVHD